LNLTLFETEETYALWDMPSRQIRLRPRPSGEIEILEMSDEALARGRNRMTRALGLVPFERIADLPEGASWEEIDAPNTSALAPGTQVYDLVWTRPVPTIPPTQRTERWRFFVDPGTHLPSRLEMYSQDTTDSQQRLYKTEVVSYPTDEEVRALVQGLFPHFQVNAPPDRPETSPPL
jgi:hypothetical protein